MPPHKNSSCLFVCLFVFRVGWCVITYKWILQPPRESIPFGILLHALKILLWYSLSSLFKGIQWQRLLKNLEVVGTVQHHRLHTKPPWTSALKHLKILQSLELLNSCKYLKDHTYKGLFIKDFSIESVFFSGLLRLL